MLLRDTGKHISALLVMLEISTLMQESAAYPIGGGRSPPTKEESSMCHNCDHGQQTIIAMFETLKRESNPLSEGAGGRQGR